MIPVPNAAAGGKDYGSSLGDAALRRLTFEEGELPWLLQGLTFSLLSFANSFKGLSAWYTTLLLDWVFTSVLRKGDCVLVCKIPKANGECSRPSALPCCSQSSSLCKEKQSSRVTRFVLLTRGVYTSRNWQALDSGALLLEQRFERTKPESVTERPRIHARRRATTLMSRVQTRRDETKKKPVQKFRTAVAIQRQRHKSRDQKKWTDAQNTSERYRKEQGKTGKKKGKTKQTKGVVTRGLQASSDPGPHPVKQQQQQQQQKQMFFFPQENLQQAINRIVEKKKKKKEEYPSTKVRSVPHGLQAFFLAR